MAKQRSARALAGLKLAELARLAEVDASTISRLETRGDKPVRGHAATVDAVTRALKTKGVEIDSDEQLVRLRKPRR
jgi:transcriptional regulator with XRE-family HTH domain